MIEARKCIDTLEQYIKNYESTSQPDCQGNHKNSANTNNPFPPLINNFTRFLSASGNLLLEGHVLDGGEKPKINSPSEVVAKFTNRLFLERRRQILAISYLIDLEITELSSLDLSYIKKTLENVRHDIDKSQFLTRN